jgi:nucleoside 2-deoxyribosyltransferase
MRGKAYLKRETSIKDSYEQHRMSTKAAIFARDKWDCLRSDIILCNLLKARSVSIGSMFEIAWAQDHGKYIIVVMEDANPHVHAFVQEAASLIVPTMSEAVRHLLVVADVYTDEQVKLLDLPELD